MATITKDEVFERVKAGENPWGIVIDEIGKAKTIEEKKETAAVFGLNETTGAKIDAWGDKLIGNVFGEGVRDQVNQGGTAAIGAAFKVGTPIALGIAATTGLVGKKKSSSAGTQDSFLPNNDSMNWGGLLENLFEGAVDAFQGGDKPKDSGSGVPTWVWVALAVALLFGSKLKNLFK